METQNPIRSEIASKLQAQMDEHVSRSKEAAASNAQNAKGLTLQQKEALALDAVKAQPGRPTKEIAIKQLMRERGMTRAQAKAELKRFDQYLVAQFIGQLDQQALSESVNHVKPLALAINQGLGGLS